MEILYCDWENCLGPMVPMEDYDTPEAMRDRYELICSEGGAEPDAFGGVPEFTFSRIESESVSGESAKATFKSPSPLLFSEITLRRIRFFRERC